MHRSRTLGPALALVASGLLVAACGGGGGAKTAAGGAAGGGACAAGAAAADGDTALTVAKEADASVATIDGSCWASIKPTNITIVGSTSGDGLPSGASSSFKVAWSDKDLYIQAYTLEWPLNVQGGANWWQSDSTEYTVSDADDHGGSFDSNTFQFAVTEDGTMQTTGTDGANADPEPTGLVKVVANKGFYTELIVPWTTLAVTPAKGGKYQFDIAEDFGDSSGNRVAQLLWAGDESSFYNSTSTWGDITLG